MTAEQVESNRRWRQRHPEAYKAAEIRYAQSEKGKARRARAALADRARHPDRHAARHAVNKALLYGRITRLPCAVCNEPRSQAHHANGYDEAHHLNVVWLCNTHHREAHR